MNKVGFWLAALLAMGGSAVAQTEAARTVAQDFFTAFNAHDTVALSPLCAADLTLRTVYVYEDDTNVVTSSRAQMMAFVQSGKSNYNEKIGRVDVRDDGLLAYAWVPYHFYVNGTLLHCGVNLFTLVRKDGAWVVGGITDSRSECSANATSVNAQQTIGAIMDNWHKAAGKNDLDAYFKPMADDFVYLGTDETERWTKAEFWSFTKPWFEAGKGWNFVATGRFITLSGDGITAWVDETLDTHMGPCRGTAVLELQKGVWMLKHYSLTVLVPNKKMDKYRKLLGVKKK
jgi:ketosteroid isomerase-like protein